MTDKQPDNSKALTPVDRMKRALSTESVQQQFQNALAENAPLFVASLIDVYASDNRLQKCEPRLVIMEALKAATLDLPINRQLGFAYIIPYDKSEKLPDGSWRKTPIPQFQPGYKAFIQLAMRTGQYRFINADVVYDGETVNSNRITGELTIGGQAKSETVIGYFAYFQTINGFEKAICWTRERVLSHAKKFSRSFGTKNSVWESDFDAMALKTVLKNLLSKYGILSVKMTKALVSDAEGDYEARAQEEIQQNANEEIIDVDIEPSGQPVNGHAADGTMNADPKQGTASAGPGF